MAEKRIVPKTMHCVWCSRIHSGKTWMSERRKVQPDRYSNVVCQRCRSFYLDGFDLEGFLSWCKTEIR